VKKEGEGRKEEKKTVLVGHRALSDIIYYALCL
jgi:hypothetical protein